VEHELESLLQQCLDHLPVLIAADPRIFVIELRSIIVS